MRPFIRLYDDSDRDAMVHVFRETASPDLRDAADPAVLDYASYIWCRPYLMLRPDTCLVLDDGTGHAVGYLLGVPDTYSFVQAYKAIYIPNLWSQGFEQPGHEDSTEWTENLPNALRKIMFSPDMLLHQEYPEMLQQRPAHLHIDILPGYQKQGYGRQLIERFCETAGEKGARGVHLGMVASNDGAGQFYRRMGFKRFPRVLDGSASGEQGRDQSTIWLVKDL
ncbi:hypothetical protein ABEF92_008165 [Exophiala dermatitidis]|nr:hypothetical protein HRR75_006250 [Exophiala dermatitidis]KAJ4545594.1 hypothetical protein HRR78_006316 [Exophiala dermatitidis]KAJ4575873.1 hypothetical protein HRR82_006166 [Exophiala dermatitidis]